MKIVTEYRRPPFKTNTFDWSAWDDDTYEPGCPIGFGATKEQAIEELREKIEERDSQDRN